MVRDLNLVIGSRSAGLPQNKSVIWLSAVQSLDHRLFSQITHSWSGVLLLSIEDAARRAAETTTSKGLTIYVDINTKTHEIQRPIDESYEKESWRRIISMDTLPKVELSRQKVVNFTKLFFNRY
ncbi:MAG: hypothetical protein MJZ56_05900 [Bacteroidales bacterium]|nr:hypothetical protein [Bacteroidales bacterium]